MNDMKIAKLKIEGMTCDACATHIEKLFKNEEGIIKKEVSFPKGRAEFHFNSEKITEQDIIKIINDTDTYRVTDEMPEIKTVTFEISGMTCNDCAKSIDKKFKGIDGIIKKAISFPKNKGEFSFNSKIISENTIKEIINRTHYKVKDTISKKSSDSNHFNLIIIGGGSAAFSAAIKAESLGVKTLMVNAGLDFGGTCVNVGCVPSKFLIRAGETAYHATHSNFEGVKPKGVVLDFKKITEQKKKLVAELQQKKYMDVVSDFKQLTMLKATAKFMDDKTIIVDGADKFTADKFLIATGSSTNIPKIEGLKDIDYLTNVTLFDLEEKPESLTVLGAGYIGLEIATAYNRLGVKVRIIEFTDRVLRTQTADISEELQKYMRAEGIEIFPNYRVQKFEQKGKKIIIHYKQLDGTIAHFVEKGKIMIATGTKPNTQNLGTEKIGLKLSESGHILINEKAETNIPHIYAAGDVADTPAFVYTAAAEGNTAIENAFGIKGKILSYNSLSWVVFTDPQVAGTGYDEVRAEKAGIPYEVSKLELKHVPRAIAANDMRGFIKLIRNKETDKLIGARIVAPEGGELIQQLSTAIKYGIPVKDLAENLYPYLTMGEGIKLAAITFGKDVSKLSCCAS